MRSSAHSACRNSGSLRAVAESRRSMSTVESTSGSKRQSVLLDGGTTAAPQPSAMQSMRCPGVSGAGWRLIPYSPSTGQRSGVAWRA